MTFHTYGELSAPVMVLIHGVLTPWQIWEEHIAHYKDSFRVIAVELDAHDEDEASEFISVQDEAKKIEDYLIEGYEGRVFAVCGLSMGGVIAHEIWKNGRVHIEKLVMDGAPLKAMPNIAIKFMTGNYLKIIAKSKQRDPKTLDAFKRDFLPEKYLDTFLKIADNMSESSVRNIVSSACSQNLRTDINADTKVLYIHGTKGNEMVSKKVGKLIKKHYPDASVICFDGYKHCEAAIYQPEKWQMYVDEFLIG